MDDEEYKYACNMYSDIEGFPPEPPPWGPAKYKTFTYDHRNGLRVGGFSRASLADLKLLFRRNASAARRAIATKPWITAQLRLYDIAFKSSVGVSELYGILAAAVTGGKVS